MIQVTENPASFAPSRALKSIGLLANAENDSENLIELQADWLLRRYPITRDRARLVAGLYFGGAA